MNTALLLIALGFGFKIFAESGKSGEKPLKGAARLVGGFIMAVALAGIFFTLWNKCSQTPYACSKPYRYAGAHGMYSKSEGMGPNALCPFMGKSDDQGAVSGSSPAPEASKTT